MKKNELILAFSIAAIAMVFGGISAYFLFDKITTIINRSSPAIVYSDLDVLYPMTLVIVPGVVITWILIKFSIMNANAKTYTIVSIMIGVIIIAGSTALEEYLNHLLISNNYEFCAKKSSIKVLNNRTNYNRVWVPSGECKSSP